MCLGFRGLGFGGLRGLGSRGLVQDPQTSLKGLIQFRTSMAITLNPKPFIQKNFVVPIFPSHSLIWGFPKIRGTFLVIPINKDYSILGSTLGSLVLGNYHIALYNPSQGAEGV